ncbi:MAG: Ribosomal large subunit pseudouridine synthase B [Microgenomates bacterium OLB23]|nr:MAG: Ribosomal large subunit pseudouridine synthase B [Microgenomates bacterium OLB23]
MTLIRLNHYIAQAGIASRRAADTLIGQGRVKVDDKVVKAMGVKINPSTQKVSVLHEKSKVWKEIEEVKEKITYVFYKPRGYTTTLKGQRGEKTIAEFLPKNARLFPVGRLDKDSEGLLLLTNNGELALTLTHPRTHVEKTYHVWCRIPKEYTENAVESQLGRVRGGVKLDGIMTKPMRINIVGIKRGAVDLEITLTEGRNRQIRRVLGKINLEVTRLIRTKIGTLTLKEFNLQPGELYQLPADYTYE